MKINFIKIMSVVLALTVAVLSLCSCAGKTKDVDADVSETTGLKYESWWTDAQKKTIDSIRQCDKDGFLYEINYTADYNLDKLIAEGVATSSQMKNNFKKLFLNGTKYDVPLPIYGGCAAFATKDADGNQIMGRNYDWQKDKEAFTVLHCNPENGYASVAMTDVGFIGVANDGKYDNEELERLLYAPVYSTDGVNEKGLACTVLLLDEDGAKQDTGKASITTSIVVRILLDKAATVKEAEELLNKYDIVSAFYKDRSEDIHGGESFHWLVTDKSGDAAIFEVADGKLSVNRTPLEIKSDFDKLGGPMSLEELNKKVEISYPKTDKGYQLITNFYVTEGYKNNVGEGYWRYQVLDNNLKKNPHPTKKEAMKYLEEIHFYKNDLDTIWSYTADGLDPEADKTWGWLTVWSEVYDCENGTMDVCIKENYETTYTFGIK